MPLFCWQRHQICPFYFLNLHFPSVAMELKTTIDRTPPLYSQPFLCLISFVFVCINIRLFTIGFPLPIQLFIGCNKWSTIAWLLHFTLIKNPPTNASPGCSLYSCEETNEKLNFLCGIFRQSVLWHNVLPATLRCKTNNTVYHWIRIMCNTWMGGSQYGVTINVCIR